MKALVICIRGSMSFKVSLYLLQFHPLPTANFLLQDVLTCMSFSTIKLKMRGGKEGYIHGVSLIYSMLK